VVLYECGIFAIRKQHILRVFEDMVLRGIIGLKGDGGENCITRRFVICILHQVKLE
jgi:hypothetical protein